MANVGDVKEMSRLGIELLSNEAMLKTFKQNAREHALKFDIHHIIPSYEKLYERFVPATV
jgi:glycosyltransferase involved in cell wall biosynthesis